MALGTTGCTATYSEGDRAGIVTKWSHKGFISKSWEGQLAMDNFRPAGDGGTSNSFEFTVRDENTDVQQAMKEALKTGDRVELHYKQVFMHNPFMRDSDYEIQSVTVLGPPSGQRTAPILAPQAPKSNR